jgi:hypothetical protein
MSNDANLATPIGHDKLESQIKTAEGKLKILKGRAQANVEIKAIAALPKTQVIRQKLQELKEAGGDRWEQTKTDLERRIADFEKSVQGIESKARAS